ncbi:MAG TPA: FtsX-like permease family protein [Thermoanaerobaculia bacterium]|nr:FtsX-like permease family protein [Thermoanaerobaculia bacterium]
MGSWLAQIGAVTWLNLRNVPQRLGASLATVVGVAGVVMVMVGVLSMASGFESTLATTGRDDAALVLRAGADSELSSGFGLEETRIIAQAPGVRAGKEGALASAELFVIVDVPKRSTGTDVNVPMRGVQPAAFAVRKELRIVDGRGFEPGRNEVIVGAAAAREFSGLEVGALRRWGENEWKVVGHFSTGGTVEDSEIWADVKVLQPAYRRGNSFQSVRVVLDSADAFATFEDSLTADPRVNVDVIRESAYYAQQSRLMISIIRSLGYAIALLMGVGAVFGALNTMYMAVSARGREIATLRALGFGAGPVVASVLAESLLLAAVGAAVGGGIAFALFNGFQAATINFQTFSQVAFSFAVTPDLLLQGTVFALVMGALGGLFPALRAARQPVAAALRRV